MRKRTKRACTVCGKAFYGNSSDNLYCPECARAKKLNTVVRIRTCQDCGIEFFGGPRAKRCPDCAYKADRESSRRHKKNGTRRPLGSIDKCVICGKEYTVISGRQKYCSEVCQRKGVLEWQRERKKKYNKEYRNNEKSQERRKQAKKICVYCLRVFHSSESTNLCSEYCRHEQILLRACIAGIGQGQNRNYDKYIDKRNKYREDVAKGMSHESSEQDKERGGEKC